MLRASCVPAAALALAPHTNQLHTIPARQSFTLTWQDPGSLWVGAGVRGRLVDPILGYELDGQEITLAVDSDGGLWSRRRWGLKPLRRREGPSVQLHLHSPAGEEVCASTPWPLFV